MNVEAIKNRFYSLERIDEIINQEGFRGEWIDDHKYWTNPTINLRIQHFNGFLKFYNSTSMNMLFLYDESEFMNEHILDESKLFSILKEAKEKKLLTDIKGDFK